MYPRGGALLVLAGALACAGCAGTYESKGPHSADVRLVTGKLRPPSVSLFARQPLALELVAAALDARQTEPVLAFYSGTPVSPAENGGLPVSFRLAIPTRRSVVMFFQVPVDGSGGIGHLIAPLRFARNASGRLTDLLFGRIGTSSAGLKDLELGTVDITLLPRMIPPAGAASSPAPGPCQPAYQVLLGEGDSNNPLKTSDADGDGVPDYFDTDTNKNGIPDEVEIDVDGDGVPDSAQSLDAHWPDMDGCLLDRFR